MRGVWIFNDLEIAKANPPDTDLPDEICDKCYQEIGDDMAYRFKGDYAIYCADCCLVVARCDQCAFIRCTCPEDN